MCLSVGQIIEYEDYDNTTDVYHVNEYEYEEEEERYGPAEREREFSLNTQVLSIPQTYVKELFEDCLVFIFMSS